ncbi:MAG: SIS domain-containing protein [Deltaproteobacteria bacterium]|jgi:D-sedoheptulose 7-phosphate isomerase|nr:SIS domain-containing protein [Deltaproteobacteria bacterium]
MENAFDKSLADLRASVDGVMSQKAALVEASRLIARSIVDGKTVHLCGNGGSAAEAQHFAAEFVGRFLTERPGLPAISLATDTSKLTAIGNDYGFDKVFSRQLEALGRPGDVLWGLSTSGTSPNVLAAFKTARERGLKSVFTCGRSLADPTIADVVIYSPAPSTPRIQELHLFYGHLICELVDFEIFRGGANPFPPKTGGTV